MKRLAHSLVGLLRLVASRRVFAHYPYLVIGMVTLAVAAVYLWSMLRLTDGQLASPIDDVYIHYRYAQHMATGRFYEFNPGDGLSTGATSLLWTPIVAVGYLLGFTDQSIIGWTYGLNVVCLFFYGIVLYRLARLFFDDRLLATLLATVIIMEGRVLWGFFAGMEIGLYHLLLVLTLYWFVLFQRDGRRKHFWGLIVVLCLLVLVRPEGAFLAGMAIAIFVLWRLLNATQTPDGFSFKRFVCRREWLALALPLAFVFGQWLLFYVTTGQVAQNGMRTKSHLYAPDQTLWGVLEPSFKFYRDMIFRHFPWLFAKSLRHVLDIFLFVGFLYWSGHELRRRRPGLFCTMAVWFFIGLFIQSIILNAAYHHGRYQMNYTFIFWFVLLAGIHLMVMLMRIKPVYRRIITGGVLTYLLLMMVNTIVLFSQHFAKDCRAIQNQHVAMAHYVNEHVPAGASVAVNDVGAIGYYGQRYVYDIYGLTTNVSADRKWDGQACIWEQIYYLDPDKPPRRPDYFAIYKKWYPLIFCIF